MANSALHALIQHGDPAAVRSWLNQAHQEERDAEINAYDAEGYTPLMRAVLRETASVELMQILLEHGGDPHLQARAEYRREYSTLALAVQAGNPGPVELLLQHGADLHYQRKKGYTAMIDAAYGHDVRHNARLLDLLRLLLAYGVDVNAETTYGEYAAAVLAKVGRFDGTQLLLQAGADPERVAWTPLHEAVACGTIAEVQAQLERGGDLEARDEWECTPWLLALQRGIIEIAELLQARGADTHARGRCARPPLFYAIEGGEPMVRWLLAQGASQKDADEFGTQALAEAAEKGDEAVVQLLLQAGANPTAGEGSHLSALWQTERGTVARCLLEAGAHPRDLQDEARRDLLGLPPAPDAALLQVSRENYLAGKNPRFGTANPEKMIAPFWEGMIRSGLSGYQAWEKYKADQPRNFDECIWCARRFGQSLTFLPDGRIIQVGGEHEDHYDPDFCIYNDVFVHHPDGRIDIYGYPPEVFPPTDFHTATVVGDFLYLVGSLGYPRTRQYGVTPVYRLHLQTWQMEALATAGESPGWIRNHRAAAVSDHELQITGGEIIGWGNEVEVNTATERSYTLDLRTNLWRIAAGT